MTPPVLNLSVLGPVAAVGTGAMFVLVGEVLLSFDKALIPPTAGTTEVDPAFTADIVLGEARPWEPGPTISNSFGFGGHNGTVVIGPPTG